MNDPSRWGRGYVRTSAAAMLASLALAATLSGGGAAAAPGRAPAVAGFRNGRANAVAKVASIAPGVGSLSLGVISGISIAQVANDLAQGQAQTLDLGLIGTSLTAQQCDGSPPSVRPDQLPQPTTVDNRKGDATASRDQLPVAGTALGLGRQQADAAGAPSAHAAVSDVAAVAGPVLAVSGGRSDATSRIVDGNAREAEATVSMDLDIAGVVELRGARWRAFHRTALDPGTDAATGSFEVASAAANGVPLPVAQLQPLEDAINAALVPSGITVALPHVVHVTAPNDFVQVTPLTVLLKDSPAGKAAFGPGLNLTRAQREQLFDTVVGVYCQSANVLLVGDITADVASGTGFLSTELGGATATTAAVDYRDPFGSYEPFTLPVPVPDAPGAANGAAPTAAAAVPRPAPAPPAPPPALPAAAKAPLESVCESIHPNKGVGCSKGLGAPFGVAGLGLVVGVGYLDWRRQRAHALAVAAGAAGG